MDIKQYLEIYGYKTTSLLMANAADAIYFLAENAFYTNQMNQAKFDDAKKLSAALKEIAVDLQSALKSIN